MEYNDSDKYITPKQVNVPNKVTIEKIIGYILLSPPILSVLLFFMQQFFSADTLTNFSGNYSESWVGDWGANWSSYGGGGGGGGGYTSALPFYFGLMAIAGAYLIKDSKK